MKLFKKMLLFGALLVVASCDVINPEEEIPSYLYIDNFTVVENPLVNHGSLSEKITNAYVFIGGEYLGVYTLPAAVPVYGEGEMEVVLDPTIRINGLLGQVGVYPFYERVTTTVNLSVAETDTLKPVTRYKDDTRFQFVEDFDFGGNIFTDDRDGDEGSFVDFTTEDVFEGDRSGLIVLTEDHPIIEVATNPGALYNLKEGGRVFLEVNYKTDIEIRFGLVGVDQGTSVPNYEFGLVAKDEWNKVYFELTDLVSLSGFEQYQIGLIAALPLTTDGFTLDTARIHLDNVKLVTF